MNDKILDNFEHGDLAKYRTNHTYVESYEIDITQDKSKFGTRSLKVTYDYSGWKMGNGAMPIKFNSLLQTDDMPIKVGLWVYGQGEVPWLRMILIDGDGERKTVNLTLETMSWEGWKYVDAKINSNWVLPLQVEQVYAVEVDKDKQGNGHYNGVFYLDEIRFVYQDIEDLKGPVFKNTFPKEDTIFKDSFTFLTTVVDDMSGVDPSTIVVKINGQIVKHIFSNVTSELQYTVKNLAEGTLHIMVSAKDYAGNISVPSLEQKYEIDLSPDTEKPIISNITPTETAPVYTRRPRITFLLTDEKSGIDTEDIHVKIDGVKQHVYYDESTGWTYVLPQKQLSLGKHVFTIKAKDRAGNELDPVKKTFTIYGIKQPKRQDPIQVAVIPDTHSDDYGKLAMSHVVTENTHFIIHMGDLVDQSTPEEFVHVKENIREIGNVPLLTVPGNHESFQGNLKKYMKQFGSPTYHLEYGNSLFVFLNTAYNQSITMSDSTQFHYVEELLKQNTKKNIIVITHVPTKDPFDTAHEMDEDDAEKLEMILSSYKQKYPENNITVLFGHVHALYAWELDGVQYIITGNGARKSYVSHERGNILGYGILRLTNSDIFYQFKPYIREVYVYTENGRTEQVTLRKGSSVQLQLYVKISELDSNYKVNVTPFSMIHRDWTSCNEDVVSVNDQGIVKALENGSTYVTVNILRETAKIKINVFEPLNS